MRRHDLVVGLVLIMIGGPGLLLLSAAGGWGPGPTWGPGMMGPRMMGGWFGGGYGKPRYSTNGERISGSTTPA